MKLTRRLILGSAAGLARLGRKFACHRRGPGRGSSGQGQGGRIRKGLLAVRRRLLLHPGHRYLHQAWRLSARRHYLQRQRSRTAGLERRPRRARPVRGLLLLPFPSGADGGYPYRHRIRRCPDLHAGRLPVHDPGQQQHQPGQLHRLAECRHPNVAPERGRRRLCRDGIHLPPVRRFHLRQVGVGLCLAVAGFPGQHQFESASAAKIPIPASTTSSTPRSSATACPAPSASTIPSCGTAPRSSIWRFR